MEQARQQLAPREVAGGAEEHDDLRKPRAYAWVYLRHGATLPS
jgi:hypothetical protein